LKDGNIVVGQGARYLGYGVMEAFASSRKHTLEGQLTRSCLQAPFSFSISMLSHKNLSNAQREEVLLALKLLGLLGSLGSKARKGYGSLTLTGLTVGGKEAWSSPTTVEELRTVLSTLRKEMLGDAGREPSRGATGGDPLFTSFSAQTRVLLVPAKQANASPLALLDLLGREMVRYRSYGHNGRILGNEPRENPFTFQEDHDLMKLPMPQRLDHPERIAFGLPHNYGPGQDKQVKPWDQDLDRRASPLFLHIHQASESAPPVGVLCLMPATFLPEGNSHISVGGKRVELSAGELWKPIERFLDRLRDGKAKEPFGSVMEVTRA
jgi:CRISPR-associated protein Cmr1